VHAFIIRTSTSLFKYSTAGEIPDNKSLESDLINYVKTLQTRLQDDRKQTALCLCDPAASGWYFEVADPTSRYIDPLSH
jgi:hypothetical protein